MLVIMAALLTLLMYALSDTRVMRNLELGSMDQRFVITPQPAKADTSIVMVAIDDASLKYVRDKLNMGWPWPRLNYGLITEFLADEGARSTVFDISFEDPDLDRGDIDPALSDENFALAIESSRNAVLAVTFTHYPTVGDSASINPAAFPPTYPYPDLITWQGALAPYPPFARVAHLGGINLASGDDSTIRRIPLIYRYKDGYCPSLALAAYRIGRDSATEQRLILAQAQAPDGSMYLNWHGPAGPDGVFRYIPFSQLLECALAERNGFDPPRAKGWFKDRNVFIGAVASGLEDLKASPYTWGMPGMEVWATQLSNLLGGNFVSFLPAWGDLLLIFLLSLLVMLLVTRLQGALASVSSFIVILVFTGVSILLFGSQRLALNYSSTLGALLISWLFTLSLSYTVEGRHKKELRRVFDRYLHPDLVKRIVDNPELVSMGGEELQVTVMFSDIYNFTTFSEGKSPQDLVSYLNEYFRDLTGSVLDYHGLLDKYTGDGLMAVFGAPIPREDHALLACKAALAHRRYSLAFAGLKELTPAQHFHLNTRLGINSGTVVSGNIGSERRMEYTSIGDPVNLSSRLEGVNKVFQTHIIISDSTFQLVKDKMLCRELDYLRVKGKHEATRIYELIEELDMIDLADYAWLDEFARALELYRQQDFPKAAAIFERLAAPPLNDKPSLTMLERCQCLIKNPPEDWDGIFTLDEK